MPKDNGEVNTRLREWAEAAGLSKHLHFHVARHTFCLLELDAGNDLYTQSKLMGHRDIASTKPYLHILDKKKVEAVSKYPKL